MKPTDLDITCGVNSFMGSSFGCCTLEESAYRLVKHLVENGLSFKDWVHDEDIDKFQYSGAYKNPDKDMKHYLEIKVVKEKKLIRANKNFLQIVKLFKKKES